jgi:Domain of unknown function (DUF5666)
MKCPQTLCRRSVLVATVGVSLAASLAFAGVADAATTPSGGSFSPPTSGSVAAITGSSMEVQNQQTGQVTVNWTPSTTFSQVASVPSSSAAAGDCATVSGSSSKGTITAKTVTISQPTAGKCNAGGAGGFGGRTRPSGASGRPAGGFPGGRPGGTTGGRRPGFGGSGNVGFASGTVKSATPTSLVISGFSSASITKNAKSNKKAATPKTTTVKVKTTSSTTYTENQAAASTNLAVGDCVTAAGSSDSTGAVSATTVRITSTGGQTCTTGFGRGGFGG